MNLNIKTGSAKKSLYACTMLTASLLFLFSAIACAESLQPINRESRNKQAELSISSYPLVTFIELGSVKCIPCRKMQPVMEAVQARYGAQLKIIFYDVWKAENHPYAKQYAIRMIPTQVFLDRNGKEFFRHAGFFPEVSINQLLEKQGLKPL